MEASANAEKNGVEARGEELYGKKEHWDESLFDTAAVLFRFANLWTASGAFVDPGLWIDPEHENTIYRSRIERAPLRFYRTVARPDRAAELRKREAFLQDFFHNLGK